MGATSVTGVSGVGSASKYGAGNKGSEHMALGVHRLIGPRVVGCGDVVLNASGFGIVVFPSLPGGSGLYCPFLSSHGNSTFPYWGNFTVTSFTVTGGNNAEVCWEIVKKGLWGSLSNDGPSSVIANT
jgi:hypothetical protein